MVMREIFERFLKDSPVSVMFRGILENIFAPERLDQIFEETAQRQYTRELLFSTCCDVMGLVVAQIRTSVNAAYQAQRERMPVSVQALYNKLNGLEPGLCERIVQVTAQDLGAVVRRMNAVVEGPLPGYEVRILDGNHLAGTEHRIGELRRLGAAALPGQAIPIWDPQRQLIEELILEEDGHANERTLLPRVLERVQPGQCWIGDRNFCTLKFLFGIADRKAFFIIRQHGQLQGTLVGTRQKIGRGETGLVYEQQLLVRSADGDELLLRRITIRRDQPTENGEREIHLLTNLPARVGARRVAQAYRQRWQIETAFQDLATVLESEIKTLGHPDAALFGFSVAVMMFNALSVVRSALRVTDDSNRKVSLHALADEISGVWRGMEIAVPAEHWAETFETLTPRQLAAKLLWLAKQVKLSRFRTYRWTPKRKQPKRISGNRGNHVSTQEILEKRRE